MSIVGESCQTSSFSRTLRLVSAADFNCVFKNSKRTGNRHFTVLIKPNLHSHARVGFAFSKKAIKRSVQRNLVKRKIREKFRFQHNDIPPVDLVFLAKPTLAKIEKNKLDHSLAVIWQRIIEQCAAL